MEWAKHQHQRSIWNRCPAIINMPNVQHQYVGVRVPKRGFSGAKKGVSSGLEGVQMVRVWWAIKGVKLTQLNTPLRFEWVRVFSLVCLQLPLQELMLLRGLWCCCCACCCCCGGGCMFNHNWHHLHHCFTAKIRETSQRCENVSPNDEMTIHPCL